MEHERAKEERERERDRAPGREAQARVTLLSPSVISLSVLCTIVSDLSMGAGIEVRENVKERA